MMTRGGRTGRPRDGGGNREAILAAARQEFASTGFSGATLRSIARAAGVDVALLSHYFGNKRGLFAATLELPVGAGEAFAAVLPGPVERLGERITRWYLGMWEHPDSGAQMRALTRSALGDEAGGDRIRDLVLGVTTAPAFDHLLGPSRTGLTLAMAHLLGVACVRHLARIPPLPDLGFDELVARTAPAVQLHLNADTGR